MKLSAAPSYFDARRCLRTGLLTTLPGCCLVFALGAGGIVPLRMAGGAAYVPPTLELRDPSVVVLKGKRLLHLFDGGTLIRTYPIDLGTDPLGPKTIDGDGRTPIGTFRIVSKNPHSPHHQFLGLSYPNRDAVLWGCARGLLSHGEAQTLLSDLDGDRCPDWTTPLGGGIGIHGGRRGIDWTGGCVALADRHIEELFRVLRVGDPVEILP